MSLLRTNQIQIGQSAIPAENFTISTPPVANGTLKISRGVPGNIESDLISIDATGTIKANSIQVNFLSANIEETQPTSVQALSTIDVGSIGSTTILVNGTASITSLGESVDGRVRRLIFTSSSTLVASASLLLPGGSNINAVAGDIFEFLSQGAGVWRCISYQAASGFATNASLETKQPTLVSGTNIKTINGVSPLGSGNVSTQTLAIDNKTSAYTVVASDLGKIINCTSGTFTVSLTAAATLGAGFNCWVWNTSNTATDAITIDPAGTETIDGASTLILRRGEGLQIISDGVNIRTGDKKAMRGYAENYGQTFGFANASGSAALALGSSSSATGSTSLAIGYATTASGSDAVAIGGNGTTASANNSTAIGANSGGTMSKSVSGAGAMALGGSYASGTDSFAAAIANNASSYGATGANSVAIGQQAKAVNPSSIAIGYSTVASGNASVAVGFFSSATGLGSVALGSGTPTASGEYSIAVGNSNTASGVRSTAFGGSNNTASGSYSYALGTFANAAQYGKQAFASGRFAANGDAQSGKMVLRHQSTSETPVVLRADGFSPGYLYNLDLDQTVAFQMLVVARNTGSDTDSKAWLIKGAARRAPGSSNAAFIGTPAVETLASDGSAWVAEAWIQNEGITVRGTGEAGKTINWVATIWTTEVTG